MQSWNLQLFNGNLKISGEKRAMNKCRWDFSRYRNYFNANDDIHIHVSVSAD